MAKKKPAADAIQDNGAKPKKPRAKKVAKAIPELGIDGNATHEPMRTLNQEYKPAIETIQDALTAAFLETPVPPGHPAFPTSLLQSGEDFSALGVPAELVEGIPNNATEGRPKNQIGLGWFAGSLHEMTREEHIAKLRHFQEHGSFPSTTAPIPTDSDPGSRFDHYQNPLVIPLDKTKNDPSALIPAERTTNQVDIGERIEATITDGIAEGTPQTDADAGAKIQGDVPASVADVGSFPGAELLESSSRARLSGEKKHNYWERMRKAARLAGLPRGQGPGTAYHWATEQTDREFPPPEPVIVEELPAAEPQDEPAMSTIVDIPEEPAIEAAPPTPVADMGVKGLGEMPESWGSLPANAQLQVEIAWVSANRLRVRSGTGVDLSRALSPAPSYSALSWLETSILFPSKFADISVKATAQQDDEREGIRREKLAIEEIRGLLAEMLEG